MSAFLELSQRPSDTLQKPSPYQIWEIADLSRKFIRCLGRVDPIILPEDALTNDTTKSRFCFPLPGKKQSPLPKQRALPKEMATKLEQPR